MAYHVMLMILVLTAGMPAPGRSQEATPAAVDTVSATQKAIPSAAADTVSVTEKAIPEAAAEAPPPSDENLREPVTEPAFMPEWHAGTIAREMTPISLYRYAAWGLGAYPFHPALPAAGIRTRVDGVPLMPISPFGPDLEAVPASFVRDVRLRGFRELAVETNPGFTDEPLSDARFFLGPRRRFALDFSFRRKAGERNGIFVGGASRGTHGSDDTVKDDFRSYTARIDRRLTRGGTLIMQLTANRDRDELFDIVTRDLDMGERRTDTIQGAVSLRDYPLAGKVSISPTLYYLTKASRFRRFGAARSMADGLGGFSLPFTVSLGSTVYGIELSHQRRHIDSRIHGRTFDRNESEAVASFEGIRGRLLVEARGGLRYSSEYGTGWLSSGEARANVTDTWVVFARGAAGREFTDWGEELYPALVFTSGNAVIEGDTYDYLSAETGFRYTVQNLAVELAGFASRSDRTVPALFYDLVSTAEPPCLVHSSETDDVRGLRANYRLVIPAEYPIEFAGESMFRAGSNDWPYPESEHRLRVSTSQGWFEERLQGLMFGQVRAQKWNTVLQRGRLTTLNAGIVLAVSTLELFYHIENVTNENIAWFDTLGWDGRTPVWGVVWRLTN